MTALIAAPMAVEALALRAGLRRVPQAPRVVRTGAGVRPHRALLLAGADAVLIAGVCGAVADGMRAGDLVVPSEVRTVDGRSLRCAGAPLLAAALRRSGFTVHEGPLASVGRLVHRAADRAALAATGAVAVDLETASLLESAAPAATAVVRAVVDAPDRPLVRAGTAVRGTTALIALARSAPVLERWLAACRPRTAVLASPRSFCAGVERAIATVERALERAERPVYVRRQIVHNAHVIADLERRGAVFVRELDEVPAGSTVVLSAHGVAPSVRAEASARSLTVLDATCPLVAKVHSEARRAAERGDTVVLIGHADHEEVVGTVGEAPTRIAVVATVDDVAQLNVVDADRVSYLTQTTLAVDEAADVAAALTRRFPAAHAPTSDDICYATSNRQAAVRAVAAQADVLLVLGSANSSNSQRLVEVGQRCGVRARLVEDVRQVELSLVHDAARIAVTAGASAPPWLVDELVDTLRGLGPVEIAEISVGNEDVSFDLPREVRAP